MWWIGDFLNVIFLKFSPCETSTIYTAKSQIFINRSREDSVRSLKSILIYILKLSKLLKTADMQTSMIKDEQI